MAAIAATAPCRPARAAAVSSSSSSWSPRSVHAANPRKARPATIVIGRVGRWSAASRPTATEAAWVIAVAIVMPMSTRHAGKRVAKASAMSWLLSPSSATKITPKLIAKACTVGAPRGSGTGSRLTSTRHAWYQVEGLARPPAAGPADRVPQGTSVSIDRLGLLPFAADPATRRSRPSATCGHRAGCMGPSADPEAMPVTDVDAEAARTYVLDTSVLLSDPRALVRFDEHDVVIPIAVLIELEAKRHHPDLGWAAREALRTLERLRVEHGSLTEPIPATEHGGTIRVELNHQDRSTLPAGLRSDDNDHRILAVAHNLAADGRQVTVVTKDLPLRLKASIAGLDADEYRNEQVDHEDWTGYVELAVDQAVIDELFDERVVDLDEARDLPCNTGRRAVAAARSRGSAGCRPTSGCTSCGATGRCSTCAAAAPSSGSPSTCWPIPTSAS